MEENIRNLLRKSLKMNHTNGIEFLWSKELLVFRVLDFIEYELNHFQYYENYDYLLSTIPLLYKSEFLEKDLQLEVLTRIEKIRFLIKDYLKDIILKENFFETYKVLKKFIGKLEILSLSIDKGEEDSKKYELLHYLVFSIKNVNVLKNILKKDKNQLNILEEKGFSFVCEVMDSYLKTLFLHVEKNPIQYLDDLLYYDRVLSTLFLHNQLRLNTKIVTLLNQKIEEAEKMQISNSSLQERYFYFLYKWKECFLAFLNHPNGTLEVPQVYEKEELMYQYQVTPNFSYGVEKEANIIIHQNKFGMFNKELPKIYTVDGVDAEELDDGFSCTKSDGIYHLGIHITNPLLYFHENSLIFKEATKRTSSIYIDDFIPMFPLSLATDLFSLNEGNARMVTSLYTTIDLEKKKILKFEPVFEPVYVSMNDTYSSCSYTLNMEVGDAEYVNTLCNIKELLPFLQSYYKIDEVYRKLNRSEFNATSTNIIGTGSSEKMIEALMIFTNHMYANFCIQKDIPCLFRNHEMTPAYKSDLANYRKMLEFERNSGPYINEMHILESNYPRSFYGTRNVGHFGLGTNCYTHFTSPDRRVPDCYNVLMLKKYFEGTNDYEKERERENLDQIAHIINQRNNSIRAFMKEYSLIRKR